MDLGVVLPRAKNEILPDPVFGESGRGFEPESAAVFSDRSAIQKHRRKATESTAENLPTPMCTAQTPWIPKMAPRQAGAGAIGASRTGARIVSDTRIGTREAGAQL